MQFFVLFLYKVSINDCLVQLAMKTCQNLNVPLNTECRIFRLLVFNLIKKKMRFYNFEFLFQTFKICSSKTSCVKTNHNVNDHIAEIIGHTERDFVQNCITYKSYKIRLNSFYLRDNPKRIIVKNTLLCTISSVQSHQPNWDTGCLIKNASTHNFLFYYPISMNKKTKDMVFHALRSGHNFFFLALFSVSNDIVNFFFF
jgi:hypothetical protein